MRGLGFVKCWGSESGGCLGCLEISGGLEYWQRVLTRWGKSRCSGNLKSRGSEVLCGGKRGRGRGDRCVSGCFGGSEVD